MRDAGMFRNRSASDTVAWRGGEPVALGQLLADVARLADRLPAGRNLLNLATDRYAFMVGFLASVGTGRVCVLPPTTAPAELPQLRARHPDLVALVDVDPPPPGLPAVRVDTGTQGVPFEPPDLRPDAVVAILYTSGSTGDPVPHAKTWGSLVGGAMALEGDLIRRGVGGGTVLGTVPAQHMYGLETTVMLPLAAGWPFHSGRPLLPADLCAARAAVPGPAVLATTPLHLRAMVVEGMALAEVAGTISSTMPLAGVLAGDIERLLGAPLVEIYGCTETGAVATRRTAAEEIWHPLGGVRVRFGRTAWCEGGHVKGPVRLADRLRPDPGGGFLLEGRAGDMIKIAGKRASLAALNRLLVAVPGVLDGVFYGPTIDRTGLARLGAIVVAPGLDKEAIFARLAERIDAAFLPRPLYCADALPREASGKLRLERLRDLVARLRASAVPVDP